MQLDTSSVLILVHSVGEGTMGRVLLIGLGGMLGAILRFGTGRMAHALLHIHQFPIGTLLVNVLGCLAIGLLAGLVQHRAWLNAEWRSFLFIGVLGGFTTFSSFALESMQFIRGGAHALALLNILGQVTLGLCAVWLGLVITQ